MIMPLKSLSVEGYTLTPAFDPNVFEYTLALTEYVGEINVSAVPENENTPREIIGAKDLHEGENVVLISLKSADGSEETQYKITVTIPVKEEVPVGAGTISDDNNKGITGLVGKVSKDTWVIVGVSLLTLGTIVMLIVEKIKEGKMVRVDKVNNIEEELSAEDVGIKETYTDVKEKLDMLYQEDGELDGKRAPGKHF